MLEIIREYAWEQLAASGEAGSLRQWHAAYFLALGEQASPELFRADQARWLDRLEQEHDNLRAALTWFTERSQADPSAGLRLASSLAWFWNRRGYFGEARRWLAAALANTAALGPTPARAQALFHAAHAAWFQGDLAAAWQLGEESLALGRQLGAQQTVAYTLTMLARVALEQPDTVAARRLAEESVALCRTLDDRWGLAEALHNLAHVEVDESAHVAARPLLEESVRLFQELGDKAGLAQPLSDLGLLAYSQGDHEEARARFEESLGLSRELGDKLRVAAWLGRLGLMARDQGDYGHAVALLQESVALLQALGDQRAVAGALAGLAGVSWRQGQAVRAARLLGAAEALRGSGEWPLLLVQRREIEQDAASIHTRLDEAIIATAWTEGRAMSLEQAIDYALDATGSPL